jgi:hypothetical protein
MTLTSTRFLLPLLFVLAVGIPALSVGPRSTPPTAARTDPQPLLDGRSGRSEDLYGRLPASFEPNRGQADRTVRFLARGSGYTLALAADEVVLTMARTGSPGGGDSLMRMRFVGSLPSPPIAGVGRLPGSVNHIIGSDPGRWRTNIPTYAGVRYEDLYRGIDLVFHGSGGRFEYDFIVAPGADHRAITLAFPGAEDVEIDALGNLVLRVAGGEIRHLKPVIYQEVAGTRHEVTGSYVVTGRDRVAFEVGPHDGTRRLVIDPVIYSTFLGGEGMDAGLSIAADEAGNAYVTGFTSSAAFPATPGAVQTTKGAGIDAFVTKLDSTGSSVVYSTYIGGGSDEWGSGIVLDSSGNAYVTGRTDSTNFPTTPGAFDRSFGGGVDAFALKLNATGSALAYSTYLGGSGFEHDRDNILIIRAAAIAVDGSGNAYLTGQTTSADFPTANAIQPTHGGGSCGGGNLVCSDVYVTKLNATGSALIYSTFLGGGDEDAGRAIFVDASGSAYLAGSAFPGFPITPGAFQTTSQGFEAFVSRVNAAGSALVFSSFLGGELSDAAAGVAADGAGNTYVTGRTTSFEFPTTPGAFQTEKIGNESDAFVTKLNATGSGLVYSTYIGERETDEGVGIAVDGEGNAHLAGHSELGAPVLPCRFANHDVFAASLNATGSSLISATCLGGTRDEFASGMALDGSGNIYVSGRTASSGAFSTSPFPITPGAFQSAFGGGATDAFVFKVGEEDGGGGGTGPGVTISDVSVVEGDKGSKNADFTVSLSASSTGTVTVNYATADGTAIAGSDYTAASGTLTFDPGQTSKTITVKVTGDRIDEPDETFTVNLNGASGATITDGTGVGTIIDND